MHDSFLKNTSLTFDLDGTLVDTAPDLVRVLNIILKQHGLKPVSVEKMRPFIGLGSIAMMKMCFEEQEQAWSEADGKKLQPHFITLYEEDICQLSRPFPGVETTLRKLRAQGAELSVCTNKPGGLARNLLGALGLKRHFVRICGSDDTKGQKPAAEHIYTAVGHRGIRPIVMIGDAAPDFQAAKAANIPCILMEYGYSATSVRTFGAAAVLRTFCDLPTALKSVV